MQALVDPAGRKHLQCAKCRVAVVLPSDATEVQKAELAAVVRQDSVQGIRFAERAFSLGPRESKVLVLHITREPGKCHRCGALVQAGESVCSCHSVNLDW